MEGMALLDLKGWDQRPPGAPGLTQLGLQRTPQKLADYMTLVKTSFLPFMTGHQISVGSQYQSSAPLSGMN